MVRPLRLAGVVLGGMVLAVPLTAQRPATPPSAYAITNARIVTVSGAPLERGTVVIRNGLIAAVGPSVTVPADARVVDGTGLTVYPGLIDAFGSLGLPAAGGGGGGGGFAAQLAAQATAGAAQGPNSNYPSGIRPENHAALLVRPAEAFAQARGAGITAALTAPGTGVFRGQSAVINLAGEDGLSLIVRTPVAQHIGFTGGGGGYPGSLMGVISAIRQLFLDAQRYGEWKAAYARNPRGMERPEMDPALEALQPVLARQQPAIFAASTQREIERALALAAEFNLQPIIAGGAEAHLVSERLRAANAAVLLSTNFPRRTAPPAADADPDPLRLLRQRAEAPTVPSRLQAAGVRFAFQSGGIANWGDWIANARRAVEGGLTADQAVRAMTLSAAELLGVADRMGSVEAGKIANLTITRGDLLAADGRVTQVFVDGRPYEVPAPVAGGGGPGARPGASGSWTLGVALEDGARTLTLSLRHEDGRLVGYYQGDFGSGEIGQGEIDAEGRVRFIAMLTLGTTTEEAVFTGTWQGDALAGDVTIVGHEAGRFAGSRTAH